MTTTPTYALNDGTTLPQIGFGTYPLRGAEGIAAITGALENGYRLLDSAVNYQNEAEVGEAVRRSGLPREQVQLTTKIPGRAHEREEAVRTVEESLQRMGVDYLDLVLIHWPNPSRDRYLQAWQALVELRERRLMRSIGVSNFTDAHLSRIIAATGVTPAVNQIECHPYFPQERMRSVHGELGIRTQSWSPLGKRDAPFEAPAVAQAAQAHGVTPAQVILRWQLQLNCLPLPKSATAQRQVSNLDVFGFELSAQQLAAISSLGRPDGRLFDGDPDRHEEM